MTVDVLFLGKSVKFSKYHALGNDYLVLNPSDCPEAPDVQAIKSICHRNFGLGSDGILYGPSLSEGADFGLRIFNPDGSEAEKSGNGLRIFARYLFDHGLVAHNSFTVETLGGLVTCSIGPGGEQITVDMGQVTFVSTEIPVTGPQRAVLDETIEVAGEQMRFYGASIGNPHCVLPVERATEALAHRLGPKIERDPLFPNRTNVQFLQILDRNTIAIEIWERGAGYTLASGSSSSAAAAVARKMGACDREIMVKMPGGTLQIEVEEDYSIRMTGPTTAVAEMDFKSEALGFRPG